MKRLILIAALTVVCVGGAALACVDPCVGAHCNHYEIDGRSPAAARLPLGRDGIARVPFYVNPNGAPFVAASDVIGAAKAAAATWERATSSLDLIYRGTTEASPFEEDGMFVIGFGTTTSGSEYARRESSGTTSDILLQAHRHWGWYPCDTRREGACAPIDRREAAEVEQYPAVHVGGIEDLQSPLTHLFGAALGLMPLAAINGQDYVGLTMSVYGPRCADGKVCRDRSTLGLGDVLGIRALYPPRCPASGAHAARAGCSVKVVAP